MPVYETVARKGPDHRPVFEIEVRLDGVAPARGEGGSKQDAQRAAASEMLKREAADG